MSGASLLPVIPPLLSVNYPGVERSCQTGPAPSLPSRAFSSTVLATMFSSSMLMLSPVTAAAAHRLQLSLPPVASLSVYPSFLKHRPPPPPTARPRRTNSTPRLLCFAFLQSLSAGDSSPATPPLLFLLLFLLPPSSLRPVAAAAVRDEETDRRPTRCQNFCY